MATTACACEGVPDLAFSSDDAGAGVPIDATVLDAADEDVSAADAGVIADASTSDAMGRPPKDAADDAQCPTDVPSGAAACCNTVACVSIRATKCANACATCEGTCADGGLMCCLLPNGSFNGCAASPAACP